MPLHVTYNDDNSSLGSTGDYMSNTSEGFIWRSISGITSAITVSTDYLPLSGGTVSGNTNFTAQLLSGSTNLYDIFATAAGASDVTRVQPGSNITTGGTGNFPIINVVDSPSFNNVTSSGASQLNTVTAVSVSANTITGTTIWGNGANITAVAHAFTGSTILNFDAAISGETSYATTAVTNSNINSASTVMVRVIESINHLSAEEALLEGLTFTQIDIVDGVGFTLAAYANSDTWGAYNIVYRIIN